MRKIYIIGNWKSNKTIDEVNAWFDTLNKFSQSQANSVSPDLEIVICPSFVHLSLVKNLIAECPLQIHLAAQNVSPFLMGAYTGEINILQLKELVSYVLVGHSERRKHFREDDDILKTKVERIIAAELTPIFCVPDSNTSIPDGVKIVAYEPVFAIGTGQADTPANANEVISEIKQKNQNAEILIYGGSVKQDNIASFLAEKNIDGVLPGGASLDAQVFWEMIVNASKS